MKAFGSVRCMRDCRVYRAGFGRKVSFTIGVKSKKFGRKWKITDNIY